MSPVAHAERCSIEPATATLHATATATATLHATATATLRATATATAAPTSVALKSQGRPYGGLRTSGGRVECVLMKKRTSVARGLGKRAVEASSAAARRVEDLVDLVRRRLSHIAEDFYDMGVALRELASPKLYTAVGCTSLRSCSASIDSGVTRRPIARWLW